MKDLGEIRIEIDKIDTELIELFKKRMDCAKAVGIYKKENNIPVLNQNRENEILDNVEEKGGEYGSHARLLFSNIMELSRALQHNIVGSGKKLRADILNASSKMQTENVKVGYQGIKGGNGHEATLKLFPNGDAVNYKTFADVFDAVDREEVTYGVLPVENSTAGSVSAVYDLILKHRFYIVKALDLPIDYCLAGLKQSEFSDIEKVWSHPQSLSQCANYIAKNNFDSTPFENTAVAAREVASEKRLNVAAICSYKAAEEYGLKILDNHLQDDKGNTTRFIVISKTLCIPENANKISLCFSLPHVTGSLYGLLCRFNSLGLNLTKIESRPRKGKDFEYLFYLDFSGSVYSDNVIDLISQLSEEMPEFSFLGNYCEL
ncbi:bifunctional chorismate mutase/prephenate dehydratase [Ruminococcus sp.]|uniref:bifunctional chorismate mutase/prephenate dehydratase n=1 Tax=Ruminococcus sp. TaxID=41978 RepID=UPI00262E42E7|nr:bifunctional chorismate mutase/prephenate dehydratase [Ruminococcus sp.]MDD6990018.1 prephenate dehydratase domain-containing protein [Ruminococcus sp.]MDY6202275.1 prephenate dehydratase domain-containing protein [Ruminococcus sp.]